MRLCALEGSHRARHVLMFAEALIISRLVAIARGEQEYFDPSGIPTATEACKSNALMRCCKDLGIASELWCVSWGNASWGWNADQLLAGIRDLSASSKRRIASRCLQRTSQPRRSG